MYTYRFYRGSAFYRKWHKFHHFRFFFQNRSLSPCLQRPPATYLISMSDNKQLLLNTWISQTVLNVVKRNYAYIDIHLSYIYIVLEVTFTGQGHNTILQARHDNGREFMRQMILGVSSTKCHSIGFPRGQAQRLKGQGHVFFIVDGSRCWHRICITIPRLSETHKRPWKGSPLV